MNEMLSPSSAKKVLDREVLRREKYNKKAEDLSSEEAALRHLAHETGESAAESDAEIVADERTYVEAVAESPEAEAAYMINRFRGDYEKTISKLDSIKDDPEVEAILGNFAEMVKKLEASPDPVAQLEMLAKNYEKISGIFHGTTKNLDDRMRPSESGEEYMERKRKVLILREALQVSTGDPRMSIPSIQLALKAKKTLGSP